MAHNLEINNGVASFAENGRKERAWHRLGQVFDRPMTVEEAITASHADYEVRTLPLVALTPDISEHLSEDSYAMPYFKDEVLDALIPNKKVTMRMDTMKPLGIVSSTYGVVQNKDAFRFIDTLCSGEVGEHAPIIESAGVLGQGERVFITAKFPESIILDNKGDDRVEMYIVFTTSHDGSGAVQCMVTPTRVVCNNTLNYAIRENRGMISLRHSQNVMKRLDLTNEENVEFAFKTLNMYSVYVKSLKKSFDYLKKVKVNEEWIDMVLAEVFLTENNLDVFNKTLNLEHEDITTNAKNTIAKVKDTLDSGVGQDVGTRGTGMWLMNGLTSYFQNEVAYKSDEYKFDSILYGNSARRVRKAYDIINSMI